MTRSSRAHLSQRRAGLTLIEAMCTLCVASVLFAGALPSMSELRNRQQLLAVAASLDNDINFARSASLWTNAPVRLTVQSHPAGGSCTLVHTGAANDCRCEATGKAVCRNEAALLKMTEQHAARGATVASIGRSLLFDPGKGTVTPTATLVVADAEGHGALHKVVNIVGRTRTCALRQVNGYKPCA